MVTVSTDNLNDGLTVINVTGDITVDGLVDAIKQHYPAVSQNIIWNFSKVIFDDSVTWQSLRISCYSAKIKTYAANFNGVMCSSVFLRASRKS